MTHSLKFFAVNTFFILGWTCVVKTAASFFRHKTGNFFLYLFLGSSFSPQFFPSPACPAVCVLAIYEKRNSSRTSGASHVMWNGKGKGFAGGCRPKNRGVRWTMASKLIIKDNSVKGSATLHCLLAPNSITTAAGEEGAN